MTSLHATLRDAFASWPNCPVERNPDGDDQGADTCALIASEAVVAWLASDAQALAAAQAVRELCSMPGIEWAISPSDLEAWMADDCRNVARAALGALTHHDADESC